MSVSVDDSLLIRGCPLPKDVGVTHSIPRQKPPYSSYFMRRSRAAIACWMASVPARFSNATGPSVWLRAGRVRVLRPDVSQCQVGGGAGQVLGRSGIARDAPKEVPVSITEMPDRLARAPLGIVAWAAFGNVR